MVAPILFCIVWMFVVLNLHRLIESIKDDQFTGPSHNHINPVDEGV